MSVRRQEACAVRLEAAELARSRQHREHKANGDEQKYAGDKYFMSFTKGLPHDSQTGLLHEPLDFVEYRRAIDEGFIDPFTEIRFNFKTIKRTWGIRAIPHYYTLRIQSEGVKPYKK